MSSTVAERPSSSSSSSSSASSLSVPAGREKEIDPLLKDLSEKKQSFRRSVVSLAAELKDVRTRLSSQEQSFARETLTRQEAQNKAKKMEKEIKKLLRNLKKTYASTSQQYLKELDDLRSQLSATQAKANASAASAQSAQLQCLALLKELDETNSSLKEHETRIIKLREQLDLQAREFSQKQPKDEVFIVEHDITEALAKGGANKGCELRKILGEISPKNFEKLNKLLTAQDAVTAELRDEIRIMSADWKLKNKERESQLEKHHRAEQGLKKKVLKLKFRLHESRSQTQKLQRMVEQRDKALKELKDQLATKQSVPTNMEKQNFWETSGFKIVVSVSMLILVVFSKHKVK